jgi:CheY-like chemotaxis protein
VKGTTQTVAASVASRSALIVDDDSFSQAYFGELLSAMGITDIHTAGNGRIGLRTLAELPRPADFLICDIFMPDMDGIEFLAELVKRKYQGGIVLVSGLDIGMMTIAQNIALDNRLKVWGSHTKPVSQVTLAATLNAGGIGV